MTSRYSIEVGPRTGLHLLRDSSDQSLRLASEAEKHFYSMIQKLEEEVASLVKANDNLEDQICDLREDK